MTARRTNLEGPIESRLATAAQEPICAARPSATRYFARRAPRLRFMERRRSSWWQWSGAATVAVDARMVKALRAGHTVLRSCGIAPGSLDLSAWRRAGTPRTGRDRWLAQLAFLDPDIQKAMLRGGVVKPWNSPEWRNVPLSWAAQRAMFLAAPAAVPRPSTS